MGQTYIDNMGKTSCPDPAGRIAETLAGKKILVLGYGREGASSLRFLRGCLPGADLSVADANPAVAETLSGLLPPEKIITGAGYLEAVPQYEVVLQSPGICLKDVMPLFDNVRLTSQTDLFLSVFRSQCIGVTGTKGKSTTASLIHHLLRETGHETLFGGNIGLPLFELLPQMTPSATVVLELSCHQLEFVRYSPHISVLLNLFEEHLDHYRDFMAYQRAKYNIAMFQEPDDYFIAPAADDRVAALRNLFPPKGRVRLFGGGTLPIPLQSDEFPLKGEHNRRNAEAALLAVQAADPTLTPERCAAALHSFRSLPHRLEPVGCVNGIDFYNDSISTIPQAAVAAVEAVGRVDTLLLGGMDRGIDYTPLLTLFRDSHVRNFLFTGAAGRRMMALAEPQPEKKFLFFERFENMVDAAFQLTAPGSVCLLSPAAPSYDAFKNFEERGNIFKKLVLLHLHQKPEDNA